MAVGSVDVYSRLEGASLLFVTWEWVSLFAWVRGIRPAPSPQHSCTARGAAPRLLSKEFLSAASVPSVSTLSTRQPETKLLKVQLVCLTNDCLETLFVQNIGVCVDVQVS